MHKIRALLHSFIAVSTLLAVAPAPAQASAPPVEAFFDKSPISKPQLSPSGKYVAMLVPGSAGLDELAVFDVASGKGSVVQGFSDTDVGEFYWISDERLIYNAAEDRLGEGRRFAPGLFAVNRDGTQFKRLAYRNRQTNLPPGTEHVLPWHTFIQPLTGKRNPDLVFVQNRVYPKDDKDTANVELLLLNTHTAIAQRIPGPRNTKAWLLDYYGYPRLARVEFDGTLEYHYLDPKLRQWRKIAAFPRYVSHKSSFSPLAFGPDGALYLKTSPGDLETVYRYDLNSNKLDPQPVVQQRDFNFQGELLFNDRGLIGIRFTGDAVSTQWIDPDMKAVQAKVDQLLPATENIISLAENAAARNMLVMAYSDAQPPAYWIYDSEQGRLIKLGESKPKINAAAMGRRKLVRYAARDGLPIPAYVTLPKGHSQAAPLVVLASGGPIDGRNTLAFDDMAQFLASRGYAVLQPDARGSNGYGARHFSAGLKQWGLAMQDDYADGAKWAVAQGIADPKRICIAGGGAFGGYVALMGLVNDPGLYRCGISWSGIVDFDLMINGSLLANSGVNKSWARYGLPMLVGDLTTDAERLNRTSPLRQAARIRQPLLLAYGADDTLVPLRHARKLQDALESDQLEWVEYPSEEGKWVSPATRFDFARRIEAFLNKQIGSGATGSQPTQ